MLHHLSDTNSIANHFIAELRDSHIQKDSLRFRHNLYRIGEVLAYEISKTFDYEATEVETPLGIASVNKALDKVVLGVILRAGVPMHYGMLNFFDKAENAFISAYRKHHKDGTFEINLENISCPSLDGKTLIIADPMLASGSSIVKSVQAILDFGKPASIHIATIIAATPGIRYVQKNLPDNVSIWVGAIDEELTAKSYIVPGLGDAGDLAFGEKLRD